MKKGMISVLASVISILIGLLFGLLLLIIVNPAMAFPKFGELLTAGVSSLPKLAKVLYQAAPLIMTGLAVAFAFKTGLFNIGASGQYTVGICASLYAALAWHWSWIACMLFAILVGALWGTIPGLLKAYCNVNVVISGIMLNWIGLYSTNMILTKVKETTSPYTFHLATENPSAILPTLGLEKLFSGNDKVTLAIPLSILLAIAISVILEKTRFGYELKATGGNPNAAKYAGMAEKRNTILTLAIAGALAGLGAALMYLTDFEQWQCTTSSVPGMGFSGIAATFLGGLNPIGTIFASYFIQHITSGGAFVDKTMYCSQISDLISSLIIYLCGFVLFLKTSMNSIIARNEEKRAAAAKAAAQAEGGDR